MRKVLIFILTLFLVTSASSFELRTNVKVGDVFKYKTQVRMNTIIAASIGKKTISTVTTLELEQRVVEVKDGKYLFLCTIKNPVVQVGTQKRYAKELEKVFTMKLDEHGNLLEAYGVDKKMLEGSVFPLPSGKVSIGYTWSRIMDVDGIIPAKIKYTYTISDVKTYKGRKCAVIEVKGENIAKYTGTNRLNLSSYGKIYVDIDKGILVKSVVKIRATAITVQEVDGEKQMITTKAKTEMRTELE